WQYADHYFRMIQTMGGFGQRNNQGWGDGGEEGQSSPQQQGQVGQPNQASANGHGEGERPGGREERREQNGEAEPGLGGVAFLQGGRSAPTDNDPAADEQPAIPESTSGTGRRGGRTDACDLRDDARRQPAGRFSLVLEVDQGWREEAQESEGHSD